MQRIWKCNSFCPNLFLPYHHQHMDKQHMRPSLKNKEKGKYKSQDKNNSYNIKIQKSNVRSQFYSIYLFAVIYNSILPFELNHFISPKEYKIYKNICDVRHHYLRFAKRDRESLSLTILIYTDTNTNNYLFYYFLQILVYGIKQFTDLLSYYCKFVNLFKYKPVF